MKKTALGRGLDALFPEESHEGEVLMLPLSDLDPNPAQPRRDFDPEGLRELAESIRQMGLLQPILASPQDGRYRIIAGERRFRAARLAGLTTVPVLVRSLPLQERVLAALTENLQREDLNAMEAAEGVRALMDAGGLTQEEAAQRLGKSRPAIANLLRLMQLPEAIQDMVRAGRLSEGHARALVGVQPAALQLRLAERAIAEGLSVRELEQLARQKKPAKATARPARPVEFVEFEEKLREAVGVRAQVTGSMHKGRIVLRYASYEELEGIYLAVERLLG